MLKNQDKNVKHYVISNSKPKKYLAHIDLT